MATASDARDIFGLAGPGAAPPPKKKKKLVEPQPRMSGFKREVAALMGDSVPPIAITEAQKYKPKAPINKLAKTRHWEMRDFQHGARKDALVLKHWKRAVPTVRTLTDVEMTEGEIRFEDEFPSDKWNVKVDVPTYTDEQYETNFTSDDWTREETDYLMDMSRDFDLRWVLIADRYESDRPRTMEALKLRYYTIAAKMMETHTPASNMTQSEFQLWEKMRNFDAKTESMRKAMVEKLFERTKDEADEERILLEELHRITKNEEDFVRLRRDLYARLESAPAIRRTERGEEQSTAMYQTSQGLTHLLQSLLSKERKFKRPPNGEQPQQTPIDRRGQPNQYSRRDTMESHDGQKKGSMSQPNVRVLNPGEQVKFGVSHPAEKLTSGVQFRHQKIDRLTMAKSQSQTTKILAALTELGIPQRLLMPTERVCREYERLIESVHRLIDVRKTIEKNITEVKVLEEMRRIRLGQPKEDAMEVDNSQVTEPKSDAVNESALEDDADGEKDEVDESAMQQDDEDAEGEEDDDAGEKSAVAEDEEDEDVEQSYANLGKDDGEEDEEEEEEEEEEEDVQIEAPDSDDDDAAADQSDAEVNESGAEESDEENDEAEEEADGDAEEEAEDVPEPEPSRPSSSHSALRGHKRSASVISDASKAGSNRSAIGRKKRAGNTTQCARLAAEFNHDFVHISLGDVLRKEADREGSVYAEILKKNLKEGLIGNPKMTVRLLKKAIDDVETGKVILIDGLSANSCQMTRLTMIGFPRSIDRALLFEQHICKPICVVRLELGTKRMKKRIRQRAEADKRDDNSLAAIEQRLLDWENQSRAVIEHYRDRLMTVQADGPINEIAQDFALKVCEAVSKDRLISEGTAG